MNTRTLLAAVAVTVATLAAPHPANAAHYQTAPDTRPCVTVPEFDRMPTDQGRYALETFVDTKGRTLDLDITYMIRRYALCDHPTGWVSVSYTLSKATGRWEYRAAVLIAVCQTRQWDDTTDTMGPWTPCPRDELTFVEAGLLKAGGRHTRQVVTP